MPNNQSPLHFVVSRLSPYIKRLKLRLPDLDMLEDEDEGFEDGNMEDAEFLGLCLCYLQNGSWPKYHPGIKE